MSEKCRELDRVAPASLFGTLSADEGAEIESHLASCPECRLRTASLRKDAAALTALLAFLAPSALEAETLWTGISRAGGGGATAGATRAVARGPAAMAAAAAVLVGLLLWSLLPGTPPADISVAEARSMLEAAGGVGAGYQRVWPGTGTAEADFRPVIFPEIPPDARLEEIGRLPGGWLAFRFGGAWKDVWLFQRPRGTVPGPVAARMGGLEIRGDLLEAVDIRQRLGNRKLAGAVRGDVLFSVLAPAPFDPAPQIARVRAAPTGPDGIAWGVLPGNAPLRYPAAGGPPAPLEAARGYLDPWGRPYRFVPPGPGESNPRIVSAGPDGVFGTPDDVSSAP